MRIVTRFAPSPTGRLHIGHAYSAMLAHDLARERGGAFLLRIEDTDPARSRDEHVAGIIEDLAWLGLRWDGEIVHQSERLALYALALEDLKRRRLIYPCFCTRRDIADSAGAPQGEATPLYRGTCRPLGAEGLDRATRDPHAWRLDAARAIAATGPLWWRESDAQHPVNIAAFGDVVVARKDAPVSYHLAVTVDDAAQDVTHVVRGRDLLDSAPIHRLLQALLDLTAPVYRHHALIGDTNGERLAKRRNSPTLAAMREHGVDPGDLLATLRANLAPPGYRVLD